MMKLIVLAAGSGRRMGQSLRGQPKCLIEVGGRTLLDWQLDAWSKAGGAIEDVVIVTGHGATHLEAMQSHGCTLVHNSEHATTNMVHSLLCAEAHFGEGFVMSYGDIAYEAGVMATVLRSDKPISVVVDTCWREYWQERFDDVLADAESLTTNGRGLITSIGQKSANADDIEAQYIGLAAFRRKGVAALRAAHALAQSGGVDARRVFANLENRPARTMYMTDLLQGLINLGAAVAAVPIEGGWVEVDSQRDVEIAEGRLAAKRHKESKKGLGV